jgi:predicted dehydrogenase
MSKRRIRLGMVGGGPGSFIGSVHRLAARMDDHYELVATALSADPGKSRSAALDLGITPERAYANFEEMARAEAARPDGIEIVAIVTPNYLHFPMAKAFLDAGTHVICDKPITTTVDDARKLVQLARDKKRIFALTHNYTGYPMVRQARAMVDAGELGAIRIVQVEYAQEWLTTAVEATGQKQAVWRTDPAQSGPAGTLADIGTHAYNLVRFVTQLECAEVCAEVNHFVPGRRLDDDVQVLLRFAGQARGMLWASQVATGQENNLKLRVYGDKAGLTWRQEDPNTLEFAEYRKPPVTLRRGSPASLPVARHGIRVPAGHPEGFLEAFAQLYADVAEQLTAIAEARTPSPYSLLVPTADDGVDGMLFIDAVLASAAAGATWKRMG